MKTELRVESLILGTSIFTQKNKVHCFNILQISLQSTLPALNGKALQGL